MSLQGRVGVSGRARIAGSAAFGVTRSPGQRGPRVSGVVTLGVDGCRAGWVGALLHGTTYDVLVAADIAGLVDRARDEAPGLTVVAIDIPIGLPDDRPRATDMLARR